MAKYQDENNVWHELVLKPGGDTLPIGTIVDYDGPTVPEGYELVDDSGTYLKIKKISQAIGLVGNVVTDISASGTSDVPTAGTVKNYVDERIDGKILWRNPNPEQSFRTKTITNIDLTGYNYIEVWYRDYFTNNRLYCSKFRKVDDYWILNHAEVGADSLGIYYYHLYSRRIHYISDTQLNFEQGYQLVGGTPSSSRDIIIPEFIVGLKGKDLV